VQPEAPAQKRRCRSAAADSLTVRQVADRLGYAKTDVVLRLIHSGRLPASNISSGRRPTWRIAAADLDAFMAAGRTRPAPARRTRRARRDDVIKFY
jgi:excisionase family DNA binding protein